MLQTSSHPFYVDLAAPYPEMLGVFSDFWSLWHCWVPRNHEAPRTSMEIVQTCFEKTRAEVGAMLLALLTTTKALLLKYAQVSILNCCCETCWLPSRSHGTGASRITHSPIALSAGGAVVRLERERTPGSQSTWSTRWPVKNKLYMVQETTGRLQWISAFLCGFSALRWSNFIQPSHI